MNNKKLIAIKAIIFNTLPAGTISTKLKPQELRVTQMIRDHTSLCEDVTEMQYEQMKTHFNELATTQFLALRQRYEEGFSDNEWELAECIYGLYGAEKSTTEICARILIIYFEYYPEILTINPLLTESNTFKYLALMAWEQGSMNNAVATLYANDGAHGLEKMRDFMLGSDLETIRILHNKDQQKTARNNKQIVSEAYYLHMKKEPLTKQSKIEVLRGIARANGCTYKDT